jgi:uncharacterized repeat protein (TIGR02543 family)
MRKILSALSVLFLVFVLVACGNRTFTVTFESNGGSSVAAIEDVELGSTITAPAAPTREGYTFDGWFTESELTNEWDFASDVVIENITLYAKWTEVAVETDQDKVDAAFAWLSLGDLDDLDVDDRVIMPTSYNVNGVSISWAIDKEEYISVTNGRITQPDHETGDQTVTITATLTLGSASRDKVFTATVKALPIPSEADPFVLDDFSEYNDGNLIGQGDWATVSGKEGLTTYTVVSTIPGLTIPDGSKAVEVKDYTETQTTIALNFTTDVWVLEMDFMQTADGAPIRLQPQTSGTGLQFGFAGASSTAARVYYRDPATQADHQFDLPLNTWHTLRLEVDMVNKTFEMFVYEDGNLMPVTPGPVSWGTYSPTFTQLYIRSGSSNATSLNENASYFTNIIGNNPDAMPRPEETVKIGDVTGIRESVTLPEGGTFTVDTPTVYNYYGTQRELILDTDYTLAVDNPVDVNVAAEYDVTYTFTSVTDPLDIVVITQTVVVFSEAEPNEITAVESTEASYLDPVSDFTVTTIQPEGTLYYILGTSATETAEAILLGESVVISSVTTMIPDIMVGENTYIHFVVELNGNSNVWSHEINHEAVTEITTEQAFFEMATIETSGHYALMNDLDFAAFTWTATGASFKGVIYGNGHTISNITINATTGYGGVFARANGAVIRDLIFDNVHVTTTARAGILVGRVENTMTLIENVLVINSSVQGADSNGVGGVIGLVSTATYMNNVAIVDSTVTTDGQKNVGGVVGRVDGATLTAEDIFVRNVTVTAIVSGTDVAAGGFVGYIRDSSTSIVNANRVIIVESEIDSIMGGALIGYNRLPGSAAITNAYVEVTFTYTEPTHAGLIGRVNDEASYLDQTTIFGSLTNTVTHAQTQELANVAIPDGEAWWTTNLPSFGESSLWTLDYNNIYALLIYTVTTKPMHEVTLDYNGVVANEVIMIREDEEFLHTAPDVAGYTFVGWYSDAAFTTELPMNYVITEVVTIYGKYETVPASTVTFTTNVDGVTVPSQDVNYGELATEPVVEDQMIEGVMKEVVGWTLNGNPFSFTTAITEDIELVAVWQTKSYTVTFDGEDAVILQYGELVTEPTEDPTHVMFTEITFNEWRLDGVAYDFNTPVTADINLVSNFNDPVGNITITTAEQFHYMATVESTYSYVLANDIDFTTFDWVATGASFKGSFDGQMFTISNLLINATTGYGGIFARANGALIQNLIIDNLDVVTTARAGGLVGRVENTSTTIENVVIMNSSIEGADSNGVGGLIGLVSFETFVFNVAVVDTFIENVAQKNVAGLVGRVDGGALIADDIFISNVYVKSTNTGTSDIAASAFVGYVRDSAASTVSAIRVVVLGTTVEGNAAGAFVGYNRYPGTANLMDAYFETTFTGSRTGLIGYNRDQVDVLDQSSIFGSFTGAVTHSQVLDLENTAIPTDDTWWDTNLNAFTLSSLWTIGVDGSIVLDISVVV